jgi:hypothetical protein
VVSTARITARFRVWWRMHGAGGCVEGVFDPLADGAFLAVGAVQVDLMQDAGAGPRPGGDFGGLAGGIEPQGQDGVPQVIRAARQRRGGQFRAERGVAGGLPGAAVDRLAEHAAAGAGEQPPVRRGAELAQVLAEHVGQDGRDGDDADGAVGAVLEAALLERRAGAGPGGARARTVWRGESQPGNLRGYAGRVEVVCQLLESVGGACTRSIRTMVIRSPSTSYSTR